MSIQRHYASIRKDRQEDAQSLHVTSNELCASESAKTFAGSRLADCYCMRAGEGGALIDAAPIATAEIAREALKSNVAGSSL